MTKTSTVKCPVWWCDTEHGPQSLCEDGHTITTLNNVHGVVHVSMYLTDEAGVVRVDEPAHVYVSVQTAVETAPPESAEQMAEAIFCAAQFAKAINAGMYGTVSEWIATVPA